MANLIQATVYQIDGNPKDSSSVVDFQSSNIMIKEATIPNIAQVQSAIFYYGVVNNQQSAQVYYVSESVQTLVSRANVGGVTQTQATVVAVNLDPLVPGGRQFSFPSNEILISEALVGSGGNATITFKGVRYSTYETQAQLFAASNSNNFVVSSACTLASGTTVLDTTSQTPYSAVFYNYSITDGLNSRAGSISAVWDAYANINWNETSTVDIGVTASVNFAFNITSNLVNLTATLNSNNWRFNYSKTTLGNCFSEAYLVAENGNFLVTENNYYLITE